MRIGYYAHHHGSGHCRQADKLAALLPTKLRENFIVFTSLAADTYTFTTIADEQIIRLSLEDERADDVLLGRAGEYWQPACLHYSPVGNRDIQNRSWQIIQGIKDHAIDLMIIDVSVEVAMLCRAASIPYLYVRLAGIRDDTPHLNAFAGALGLIAPYPKDLEALQTLEWLCQKTLYLDFLPDHTSKSINYASFINQLAQLTATDLNLQKPIITVIKGYGGHDSIDAKLAQLRALHPDALIISLGPIADDKRRYVDIATQVADVAPFIAHSDLLIMACGLNSVAQAYYHQTPLIVIPDKRPHEEQVVMAESLIAQGRALDWEQFVAYSSRLQNQTHLNFKDLINHKNAPLATEPIAQDFMDNLIECTSPRSWFYEWLLPKLALAPKR